MSRRHHGHQAPRFRPSIWAHRHLQVLFSSLGQLWRRPLGNLMSILVIAIAMALPTTLHLVVANLERLAQRWEGAASATLFLVPHITDRQVEALLRKLEQDRRIASLVHLTPAQALEEFRQYSGLGDAIELLEENPLPHVVLVRIPDPQAGSAPLAALVESLRRLPEVETASADLQWVERFRAMVNLLERGALLLALLLALAVVLAIGNTIRLEIQGRRQEIMVIRLVGGSSAFIRRPFLYEGFWYGLLGGAGALGLVTLAQLALQGPVARLSQLYGSQFALQGISLPTLCVLLGSGCLLGVLGAWIAVQQQLEKIGPA